MGDNSETRNVADYFVVAGLPKENPQLLDEYSLEVNLKPSAYQDPITDIAVRKAFYFCCKHCFYEKMMYKSGARNHSFYVSYCI